MLGYARHRANGTNCLSKLGALLRQHTRGIVVTPARPAPGANWAGGAVIAAPNSTHTTSSRHLAALPDQTVGLAT